MFWSLEYFYISICCKKWTRLFGHVFDAPKLLHPSTYLTTIPLACLPSLPLVNNHEYHGGSSKWLNVAKRG